MATPPELDDSLTTVTNLRFSPYSKSPPREKKEKRKVCYHEFMGLCNREGKSNEILFGPRCTILDDDEKTGTCETCFYDSIKSGHYNKFCPHLVSKLFEDDSIDPLIFMDYKPKIVIDNTLEKICCECQKSDTPKVHSDHDLPVLCPHLMKAMIDRWPIELHKTSQLWFSIVSARYSNVPLCKYDPSTRECIKCNEIGYGNLLNDTGKLKVCPHLFKKMFDEWSYEPTELWGDKAIVEIDPSLIEKCTKCTSIGRDKLVNKDGILKYCSHGEMFLRHDDRYTKEHYSGPDAIVKFETDATLDSECDWCIEYKEKHVPKESQE